VNSKSVRKKYQFFYKKLDNFNSSIEKGGALNFFNNINSEFLRSTIVSFESFKVHMSFKTPSFLFVFFQKHMTKHGYSWPIITFR